MFRFLSLLLAVCMLPVCSIAEAPLTFADDLTGVYTWPEDADESKANYVYRYAYPQITGDSNLALTINEVFRYEAHEALGFECPMTGSGHDPSLGQMQVDITYEISHLSDSCMSVRTNKKVAFGEHVSHIVKGYTLTLTGPLAGTLTSLPYLLGIIKDGETDQWLIDRQIAKTDDCIRSLVWARIEKDMRHDGSPLYQDLTFEEFADNFYPEQDFFLDEDGHYVFFIQENTIAPADAGQFFYTISLDELLDEL